jgi:hypothetical protein
MGLSILAALAIFVGTGTAAHAGCASSTCPVAEQPTTTQQATEVTLERRIENALKDLEIFNARAYKPDNLQATEVTLERMIENAIKDLDSATARTLNADQERLNELRRKSGVYR